MHQINKPDTALRRGGYAFEFPSWKGNYFLIILVVAVLQRLLINAKQTHTISLLHITMGNGNGSCWAFITEWDYQQPIINKHLILYFFYLIDFVTNRDIFLYSISLLIANFKRRRRLGVELFKNDPTRKFESKQKVNQPENVLFF